MLPAPASKSPARVLVTGSEGFTGRHLTPELKRRGYTVIEHSVAECDLRDAQAVRRMVGSAQPNFVVHLAAISFVAHGSPAEMYEVNTVGAVNLLDALATVDNLSKVILVSSSQVYGSSDANLDEGSPCSPVSHYACSKLAMEHMAAPYCDRLPIVITRPFNYTGPGQPSRFLVPKIVQHFVRGEASIALGNLGVVRDFSDVRAVVDVYCRLLPAPVNGQTFNICSGVGRSLRSVIEEICQLTGHDMQVIIQPEFVRASEVPRLVGSNERLVNAIGPLLHADFTATLRSMIAARLG